MLLLLAAFSSWLPDPPPRPPVASHVTWLTARSLSAAESFVERVVGLSPTGTHPRGCTLYQSAPGHHLAVCVPWKTTYLAARTNAGAMRCDDAEGPDPAARSTFPVAASFVVASTADVYTWHDRLQWANANASAPVVDLTPPSKRPASFGFSFSDINRESGLGCMRFEVVTFADDPTWPAPGCAAVAGASAGKSASAAASVDASLHPRSYSKSRALSLEGK